MYRSRDEIQTQTGAGEPAARPGAGRRGAKRHAAPPPFAPAWWLPGAHLQTVWGRVGRRQGMLELRRELWPTPDGDELVIDVHPVSPPLERARAVLLHGLEGSSRSVYVHGLAERLARRGISSWVLNFRSCARDPRDPERALPNRLPRSYHSGETGDLDLVARGVAALAPARPLVAAGVSLGGNVLLKWLGESAPTLPRALVGAATVSVPYDLAAGARNLERGVGPLYVRSFLVPLQEKLAAKVERFPELRSVVDLERARRARTFFDFDDAGTAPLHGFAGAADYYQRSSSLGFLDRIAVPTRCVSAADDPFLPAGVLEEARRRAAPALDLHFTREGGHVGFVAGRSPAAARYWAEDLVVDWLDERVSANPSSSS